jgi:large subunit ribosomal protein L28
MSQVCQVTGKRAISGNRVSHAHNKTKRLFHPNVHDKRFWLANENRWVKLRVSASGIRTITKLGIEKVVADLRRKGVKV